MARNLITSLRVTRRERQRLRALAARDGISVGELIRRLVDERAKEVLNSTAVAASEEEA